MPLDISSIRRQFPILAERINGHPLVYLDSAATAQKPQCVLDAISHFYTNDNGNAYRGMHPLAERATEVLENTRRRVAHFIGAEHDEEIIFVRNATEGINLVAKSWGRQFLQKGDRVVLTILEHHSNIVPWLQLKEERGIEIDWIDIDDKGELQLDQLDSTLHTGKVKLVAITAQSNVLGIRPPLTKIIERAHAAGALVLVDAAQAIAHGPTNVHTLACDFLVFSGHKLYGPTGIGILYGKRSLLEQMPPFLGGGQMIREVHQGRFTPADIPMKFEAGTMPLAEAAGLHAAIDWISQYPWEEIHAHENDLLSLASEELSGVKGLQILGAFANQRLKTKNQKLPVSGCISFAIDSVHPHDLTDILGQQGICLRAGHHCAQPLHERLGIAASTRLSVGIYTTEEEIRALRPAIEEAMKILNPKY